MQQTPSPLARQTATLILLIGMVGSGAAAAISLIGNPELGLQVCLGSVGLALIVLLVGGLMIASNR